MRLFVAGICLLSISTVVLGQGDRGTITGTISDPAGAVVASASIEARNVETGATYTVSSTTTGNYTVGELPAGTYELTISAPGFKKWVRQGLTVQLAQTLRIDAALDVGETTESVTISAAAPLLKTESGEISHNIEAQHIDDLPVGSLGAIRNPLITAELIPGANYVSSTTIRVEGTPVNSEQVRIEGLDATYSLGMSTYSFAQPSVDAIQEVAVQTSNYAAELGLAGGGVFNIVMKSGTNQFHGSAYDYFVNEALNAAGPFTHSDPRMRGNDYGFTVGGPVWLPKIYNGHDKTFFFFSWESHPTSTVNSNTFDTVPTVAYRNGNFSAAMAAVNNRSLGTDPLGRPILQNAIYDPGTQRVYNGQIIRDPFPNNTIPASEMDPVALKIQALIPLPQGPNANQLVNNYLNPFTTVSQNYIPTLKIDHSFNALQKISFFWGWTHSATPNGPGTGSSNGSAEGFPQPISTFSASYFDTYNQRLNYDYTLRPTMLLHLGIGYQTSTLNMPAYVQNYNPSTELGLNGPFLPYAFPNLSALSSAQGGVANGNVLSQYTLGSEFAGTEKTLEQKTVATANLTWVKDNHTYKAGAEMRIEGYPNYNIQGTTGQFAFSAAETGLPYLNATGPAGSGGTIGFPYASFLLGLVDNGNVREPAVAKLGKQEWGFFVQDSWKVTRKLTLELGLRYDYSTYEREQYGRFGSFSATTPNPSAGGLPGAVVYEATCKCNLAHNYPFALGPRLAFAYQFLPKTVIRGGAGLIYNGTANNNVITRQVTSSNPFSSPAFGQPAMVFSQGVPLTAAQIAWPNFNPGYYPLPGTLTGPPYVIDQNGGRPSRMYQWSIGIQREIFPNLVADVSYVGNRGMWWPAAVLDNYNELTPQRMESFGLNINSAADRALLASPMGSPAVIAAGFHAPYAGFPASATLAQALRPYPQFNSGLAALWAPLGDTWYNALQAKLTKRFSHGLDFTYNFTWSQELTLGTESDSPGPFGVSGAVNDVTNRAQDKYLSAYSRPLVSTIFASYTLPKWGGNKLLRFVVGDWQIGGVLTYASGMPIMVPFANNNLGTITFINNGPTGSTGTFANRVPGVPLFTVDLNCHCYDPRTTFVLNKQAWQDPLPGQYGTSTAYYNDYRQQRRPQENLSLGRVFPIKERASLSIRAEFDNIFNRTRYPNPTSTNALAPQTVNSAGIATAGFGWLNTAGAGTPRQGQIVARFRF
ncbi:MAG TPA: TonB-dependent receptor [Bryobacteraceae bacterium]|nr:TonB-dependent receptor [Bryobacteraceae bacterium]